MVSLLVCCLSSVRVFCPVRPYVPPGGSFVCLFVCSFRGVMERFGAVGDDLQAMVRGACGDLDRDRGEEDWAFSAPSQVTYYMQHIVMAGVMADAAMVDGAIERDVYCRRDPAEVRGG